MKRVQLFAELYWNPAVDCPGRWPPILRCRRTRYRLRPCGFAKTPAGRRKTTCKQVSRSSRKRVGKLPSRCRSGGRSFQGRDATRLDRSQGQGFRTASLNELIIHSWGR